jgi:hypothetical protein
LPNDAVEGIPASPTGEAGENQEIDCRENISWDDQKIGL